MNHPLPATRSPISETQLIGEIRRAFSECGLTIDVSDDCGYGSGQTDLVTTDTIVENRHFDRSWDRPVDIGRQAAVVNLSDIAGSGGQPKWSVWSLVLNARWSTEDVFQLARGFGDVMAKYGCNIIGGNLAYSDGPTSIAVTVGGVFIGPTALRRDGARPGDGVYVSGALGGGALGYLAPSARTRAIRHSWYPHIDEIKELVAHGGISACMDISDGLLMDTHRMAAASGVALHLERKCIPIHDEFTQFFARDDDALMGGEDYILLFTARGDKHLPRWATKIGQCEAGEGILLDGLPIDAMGHDHFAGKNV